MEPSALVVDAGEVFFVDNGSSDVIKTGIGVAPRLLTTPKDWVTDLAVDVSWVYLQKYTEIIKVLRAGGEPQTLASGQAPRGLAVDSSHLYFLSAKNGFEVRRLSLATGAGEVLANLNGAPIGIALDDDNVYVLSKADVLKLPKCREGQTVLASTFGLSGGLAVDAGYVYWSGDGVISRVSKEAGDTQVVIQARPLDDSFAVDRSFVYWGDDGLGQVLRAPVKGGPAEVIADGLIRPVVYAVDEQNVYFIDDADTAEVRYEVRAVPK